MKVRKIYTKKYNGMCIVSGCVMVVSLISSLNVGLSFPNIKTVLSLPPQNLYQTKG